MFRILAVGLVAGLLIVGYASQAEARGGCGCCAPVAVASAPAPVATAQANAVQGYRSYSYQPETAAPPMYRSYSPRRNAWDYPKTDMRRYNGGSR
jgi:hypothetical protein